MPGQDRTPLSVLVVDDDAGMRFALEHGLAAHGFEVHTAADAEQGSRMADELEPELVLCDWILPGGESGLSVVRRIRRCHPASVLVMLTGLADTRDQRAALEAGANALFVKGISLEELAGHLRSLVAQGAAATTPA